jgi:hypothetical protein
MWSSYALCLGSLVVSGTLSRSGPPAETKPASRWLTDYETARTVARLLDRPLFAVFA